MKAIKNKVQLIGHLGADPEFKILKESQLANMRLAVNDRYKNAKGCHIFSGSHPGRDRL